MEEPKEERFKSTGNMTMYELYMLYGTDLMPADVVLKLAEHKNFNAASREFKKWDEELIAKMSIYLNERFRHEPQLYATEDKYIAVSFLKELINNHYDQGRKIESPENDPIHQKAAELLKRRLSGVLPHIDLAGTDFTIDWRLRELRETEQPWNHIDLEYMDVSDLSDNYIFLYDTENHIPYSPEANIIEMPKNVVMLEIPNELHLDPVAVARAFDMKEDTFVADYPIQENFKAKVRPLEETNLPEIIAENIKQMQQPGWKPGR